MARTPQRHIRKPREGERLWNTHIVDINLDDVWLETLNALRVFDLISICEGHVSGGRSLNSNRPHLNFRMKEKFLPLYIRVFDDISNELHLRMVELFGEEDTKAYMEYKMKLSSSRSRQEITRDIMLHVESRSSRQTHDIDTATIIWFNKIVYNIQQFDIDTESMLLKA